MCCLHNRKTQVQFALPAAHVYTLQGFIWLFPFPSQKYIKIEGKINFAIYGTSDWEIHLLPSPWLTHINMNIFYEVQYSLNFFISSAFDAQNIVYNVFL